MHLGFLKLKLVSFFPINAQQQHQLLFCFDLISKLFIAATQTSNWNIIINANFKVLSSIVWRAADGEDQIQATNQMKVSITIGSVKKKKQFPIIVQVLGQFRDQ